MTPGHAILAGLAVGVVIGYTWSTTLSNYSVYQWAGGQVTTLANQNAAAAAATAAAAGATSSDSGASSAVDDILGLL